MMNDLRGLDYGLAVRLSVVFVVVADALEVVVAVVGHEPEALGHNQLADSGTGLPEAGS
jgi:hypothetical protein